MLDKYLIRIIKIILADDLILIFYNVNETKTIKRTFKHNLIQFIKMLTKPLMYVFLSTSKK